MIFRNCVFSSSQPQRAVLRYSIVLTSMIGVTELFIMLALNYFNVLEPYATIIDVLMISALALCYLWFFVLKPSLRELEDSYKIILSSMAEGVVIQNLKGEIVYHNQRVTEILRLSSDQILGRTSLDPSWHAIKEDGTEFRGEDHPAMVVLTTGKPQYQVPMGLVAESGVSWIKINAVPKYNSSNQNQIEGVICTFVDVTAEFEARKKLEITNERFGQAAENLGFGVWDWNLKTGVLIWDPVMYRIFEIDATSFKSDYDAFEKALLKEDSARLQEELNQTFNDKRKDFRSAFRVLSRDGLVKHIAAAGVCFYDINGKIERMLGYNWDVSNEVVLKSQISAHQALLASKIKMASLGEMAGGIAHEINSPLMTIRGRAEQMGRAVEDVEINRTKLKDYTATIVRTVDRIASIVSGLRLFSRNADSDTLQPYHLSRIVEETLALCRENLKVNGITMRLDSASHIQVDCRSTQISQVLVNLITNSIHAISNLSEKWIQIQLLETKDSSVELRIADSGPGIPKAMVEKIMEPFFTTKEMNQGVGLGLPISKQIVESHGGEFFVDTESPNTCFVIKLPVRQERRGA